jgi:hypothetical protein
VRDCPQFIQIALNEANYQLYVLALFVFKMQVQTVSDFLQTVKNTDALSIEVDEAISRLVPNVVNNSASYTRGSSGTCWL